MRRRFKNQLALMSIINSGRFITFLAFLASLSVCAVAPGLAGEDEAEKAAIMKEARSYFEAELSGDPKAVWSALAPSSVFKRDHSFDDYLAMQSRSDLAVKSYEVIEVVEIMDNNDRTVLPDVDKLAAVKVRVKISPKDGRETEHNNIFIFLKEKGKWFKG